MHRHVFLILSIKLIFRSKRWKNFSRYIIKFLKFLKYIQELASWDTYSFLFSAVQRIFEKLDKNLFSSSISIILNYLRFVLLVSRLEWRDQFGKREREREKKKKNSRPIFNRYLHIFYTASIYLINKHPNLIITAFILPLSPPRQDEINSTRWRGGGGEERLPLSITRYQSVTRRCMYLRVSEWRLYQAAHTTACLLVFRQCVYSISKQWNWPVE